MNKSLVLSLALFALFVASFTVTSFAFDTSFSEMAVDWLAFLAGIFLIMEASYKIFRSGEPFSSVQLTRYVRIVIGGSVFTIHLLQFMRL